MSQLTLENLETLKNKMIKDHEAALKLINLSIQQVKDEMGMGTTPTPVSKSSGSSDTLKVKPAYDLGAGYDRADFSSLIKSLKSADKIYVTKSTPTVFGGACVDIIIDSNEIGAVNTQVTYMLGDNVALSIMHNLITDIGLSSAQFCGTLVNQGRDGTKQISIIPIHGLPYFAINVTGKTAASKGRPITYFFNRSDVDNLSFVNRAAVTTSLFG